MTPTGLKSMRLFRVFGITVFLHWSWFLVAAIEMDRRSGQYPSLAWNVAEYLGLFAMVLLHEFGHALACRQVGGIAHEIVLWPLGGVAYVSPPPRPGAQLWSIAAGPLVNVGLVGVFYGIGSWGDALGLASAPPAFHQLLNMLWQINLGLLIFNLLPIYPLDGGQIVRSLLWYVLGPSRSLTAASAIGVVGALGLAGLAFYWRSYWIGIIALFILSQCWVGFKRARAIAPMG